MKYYKGTITRNSLPKNGIFTFGSNKVGINGNPKKGTGGAALVAQLEFGVKQGEIMNNRLSDSGLAYGLVTVNAPKKFIPLSEISKNIKILYDFAELNKDLLFFIAYDGKIPTQKSLNGYTRIQMASIFSEYKIPDNMVFEENFLKLLNPI